ncbi:unnamed protein product, partial [Ectocarpus sp. 6 AP-2014]
SFSSLSLKPDWLIRVSRVLGMVRWDCTGGKAGSLVPPTPTRRSMVG